MKTKVNAFTLTEMVIVMIISIIVMSLAFTVLSMVKKHMLSIQNNFSLNTEFNRLEQAVWIDTNKHNTITYDPLNKRLKFRSQLDSTVYDFNEGRYILKDTDTFNIELGNKVFFFNGIEVNQGPIDAIKLELPKPYKDQNLFVFKTNDAKQFID